MPIETLALFFLATVAAGGVAWVFLYPMLSGERQVERRKENVAKPERTSRTAAAARNSPKVRREQVEESLRDLEERQKKAKSPPLGVRISQAGLDWSKQKFYVISGVLGVVAFALAFLFGGWLPAIGFGFAAGFGLPRWLLAFLKKRRENRFLNVFPDAVDVIVRGIKAGLPLLDCLKMIATEASEPVRSEFRAIIETQTIGLPLGEACVKLYERVPLPEANFFGIVISIQQKAGGNLSEALGNLSRVLRERKKMKAKINAMSMEAKASAMIIAALPICVMLLVYITSPTYIALLWTEPLGRMMLACSAIWMSMGVFVMKKMINFDF
ncbi:MAG TPA: type II secretion system F family protein [Xanthobacteraceae bacterium]|jgi:tight adherence protein B